MTTGKLFFILSYLATGVWAIFLLPFYAKPSTHLDRSNPIGSSSITPPKWSYGLIIFLGVGVFFLTPWHFLALSIGATYLSYRLIDVAHKKQIPHGIFLGLIISSFIAWWLHNDHNRLVLSSWQSLLVLTATLLMFTLFWKTANAPNKSSKFDRPLTKALGVGVFILVTVYFTFTGGVSLNTPNTGQWHHWGAFIGPAELIRNGAIPFVDIPIQYGLGSALLITGACEWDCWNGLYWITGVMTALMTFALAYIAIAISQPKTLVRFALILFLVFICCQFWPAYPLSLSSVLMTPATSGTRFLPGVLMTALLVWTAFQSQRENSQALACAPFAQRYLPHNLFWLACWYWSPEAGIQASILWFSYCLWANVQSMQDAITNTQAIKVILKVGLKLLLIFAIGLAIFLAIFYFTWGSLPQLKNYLVYLIYPPGPEPVNQNGPIWFVALVVILSYCWIRYFKKYQLSAPVTLSIWLVFLLCFANFSYILGRSVDNNIINLLPYFAVLLIGIQSHTPIGMSKAIQTTLIASLIAWTTLIDWSNYGRAFANNEVLSLNPRVLMQTYSRQSSQSDRYLPDPKLLANSADIRSAYAYIQAQGNQAPIEVVDRLMLLDTKQKNTPWSALHGPANFFYVPSKFRQQYLEQWMKHKPADGWVLYDQKFTDTPDFMRDYDAVYDRVETKEFGQYLAVHYKPRI